MAARLYSDQNAWITFKHQVQESRLWMLLGEAFSKCEHMAGTPLPPELTAHLASMYLVKGTQGTTAIEGNTLDQKQIEEILDGELELPPSLAYLEVEVRNVADALREIDRSSGTGGSFKLTPDWISEQNRKVLAKLELPAHVVPGSFTTRQLVVGQYRAAPPEDVPYLIDQLCTWLNEMLAPVQDKSTTPSRKFYLSFFAAVLGHLYVAWIHPFGDGNGRTARLLECAILAHSGVVPWVSSNVLSDFYNRTRPRYYQRLNEASRSNDVDGFVRYSAEGFVDMLREQIADVRKLQRQIAWTNYVHESFHAEPHGPTRDRRIELALALTEDKPTPKRSIARLTNDLTYAYAFKGEKTVSRDLTRLRDLGLQRFSRGGYVSNIRVMDAFLPTAPESLVKRPLPVTSRAAR